MDILTSLYDKLKKAEGNWPSIQAIFSAHLATDFLDDFIRRELNTLSDDHSHIVPNAIGQSNFTFINTEQFEYSVKVLIPSPERRHFVKWFGVREIVGIKGPGSLTIRKLTVPSEQQIRLFRAGVAIERDEPIHCQCGSILASDSPHQILDVAHIQSPVVAEVLTYRADDSELIWTFDHQLRSLFAEQSSITVSRFRTVLEVAHAAGKSIPDELYDLALASPKPQIVLMAIRSMLLTAHPEAFAELLRAMNSGSEPLSTDAKNLFDALTNTQGETHAA